MMTLAFSGGGIDRLEVNAEAVGKARRVFPLERDLQARYPSCRAAACLVSGMPATE